MLGLAFVLRELLLELGLLLGIRHRDRAAQDLGRLLKFAARRQHIREQLGARRLSEAIEPPVAFFRKDLAGVG
jgi:hypothetical protein